MKRNKKFILLAVLLLTIGFAAVSTALFINGNVIIAEKSSDYKVYFSSAIQDGLDKSNILISSDKKSIDYTIEDLSKLNQTSVLEYQVTNDSSQYDANVTVSCELSDNEHIKLTNSLSNEKIEAKSQEDGTLTIELIKSSTEEKSVTLHCELVADAIERTEISEGTIATDTYTLSGYYKDEEGNIIPNANLVVYSETPHYVSTDNYGYFAVTGLEKGEHEIYYLDSSMSDIKKMTKEEVINNKVTDAKMHTNKIENIILFNNNSKITQVSSSTNEPTTYTIELDSAGGLLENTTYEVTENKVYGNLPTPTKEGYKFLGWYLEDKLITNDTYVIGTNVTKLVAKYGAGEYQISFNANGGTVEPAKKTVTFNSTYGELPTPVKIGYTFNGWFNESDELITSTKKVSNPKDEELTAKWIANEFTVNSSRYKGVYDAKAHGITVTPSIEGTTITYSLDEENYSNIAPTFTDVGTYKVYYKVTKYNYLDVKGSETVEITEADNTLTLSETSGTVTYPVNEKFEVTNNTSGGTLSVSSSDTSKAIVSIANGIVTIKPGTEAGDVTITVTSAATSNYKETSVTYTATVKNGINEVTANGVTKTYDGEAASISVSASVNGSAITYSTDGINYTSTNPTYRDAGTYTVYYQVSASGYETANGSKIVQINKANNTLDLSATSGTLTYPTTGTFTVKTNTSNGVLSVVSSNTNIATVTLSDKTINMTPGTEAGNATITVTSAETNNYNKSSTTYTLTVTNGTLQYSASGSTSVYDGENHQISVTSTISGAKIEYSSDNKNFSTTNPAYRDAGTYKVYYRISKSGYETVTGSENVVISKANNTLELSAVSGTLTYPETGSFTVKTNISNGTLSVTSNNTNIATASISDKTVTITPGTTAGDATITVTSAETTNYNKATATYSVTVKPGTLDVTTANYTGTYDRNSHSATVTAKTSGATVKYGTISGTYDLTSMPTYKDAGTYTVYYQVSKAGYTTKTGSVTVTINKTDNTLTLSATSGTLTYPETGSFTVKTNISNGTLSVTSNNTNIATASISDKTVTITPGTTAGDATITVTSAETTNYNKATATYSVNVIVIVEPVLDRTLFQSYIVDNNPTSIVFTNTGSTNKTDISQLQNGGVQAWMDGTTMYVSSKNAGESVIAPDDSEYLFSRVIKKYDDLSSIDLTGYKYYESSNYYYNSTTYERINCYDDINTYVYLGNEFGKSITSIDSTYLDVGNVTNMSYMFASAGNNATTFNLDISSWDVSNVTNMSHMFASAGKNATTFNLDISSWDVSNVTNMSYMFYAAGWNAATFNLGNLSNWDTSNVTDMHFMFANTGYKATTFNLDISSWNISNVTNMSSMFYFAGNNATTFNLGNLSNWNTSKVTNMSSMFYFAGNNATTWSIGDISNWDVSKVTNMGSMFSLAGKNATTFNLGNLSNWNTSKVTNMSSMFNYAGNNATTWSIGDISNWDVSNVTNMSSMFNSAGKNATTWSIGDLSNWDVSNVTNMSSMFNFAGNNATTWSIGDISNWDVSKVTNMGSMFSFAGKNATTWSIGDISSWNVSNVTNMGSMFSFAGYKATTFNIGDISSWIVSNVTNMSSMFSSAGNNATTFNLGNLSNWNTSKVTNMSSMFNSAGKNATTWSIGDLSNWDTSKVTNMSNMFNYAGNNATTWSIGDLSNWDVSNVTNMSQMFFSAGYKAKTFNIGYLSNWDVSNVTDMSYMFSFAGYNATTFNLGNLSNWNTSKVTNMSTMFESAGDNATTWSIGDISNWDVSNVTNMSQMFDYAGNKAKTFNIGDLSNWDVSNVTNMSSMFYYAGNNATTFNLGNLSNWDVSNVTDMGFMFTSAGGHATTWSIGDISSWNVSNVTKMSYMFCDAGRGASYSLNLSGWNVNKVTSYSNFNTRVTSKVTPPVWVN